MSTALVVLTSGTSGHGYEYLVILAHLDGSGEIMSVFL